MKPERFIWVMLLGITLLAYSPLLQNKFINFDDPLYITNNKEVFNGLTWEGIKWAFTSTGKTGNWHPLTWLSLMLDCQLFGERIWAHHLEGALWHAANTLLLFGLLRRVTGAVWRSAVVAALFAVHPLHVESVAWASERKDVLSTFFGLLAGIAWCRHVAAERKGLPWVALSCFFLSLLCKPMLVTLPLLLLVLDIWPLQRWSRWRLPAPAKKQPVPAKPMPGLRQLLVEKLPFFGLTLAFCIITIVTQHTVGAVVSETTLPLLHRPVYSLVGCAAYLWKMIWPVDLTVMYPYPLEFPARQAWLSAALLLTVTVVVLARARRQPYLLAGWSWYLISLVPVIGLVQVGSQWYADRYTYIPLIGIFIALVWSVADFCRQARLPMALPASLSVGVVVLLAAGTWRQARYWKDSLTLFEHAIAIAPDSAVTQHNYAQALASAERQAEAIQHFQRSLELYPGFPKASYGLGVSLSMMGSNAMALDCFQSALAIKPDYEQAHYGLANVLAQQGNLADARAHFEEAIRLEPEYAEAHAKLGSLLSLQGDPESALRHYLLAVKIRPDYDDGHYLLATGLARKGDFRQAAAHLKEAIKINTNHYPSLNDLAWIMAAEDAPSVRDPVGAVPLARRACELTRRSDPGFLDTLGVALSENHRFPEAITVTQEAVNCARASGRNELANRIQSHLEFYERNLSYREGLAAQHPPLPTAK